MECAVCRTMLLSSSGERKRKSSSRVTLVSPTAARNGIITLDNMAAVRLLPSSEIVFLPGLLDMLSRKFQYVGGKRSV